MELFPICFKRSIDGCHLPSIEGQEGKGDIISWGNVVKKKNIHHVGIVLILRCVFHLTSMDIRLIIEAAYH